MQTAGITTVVFGQDWACAVHWADVIFWSQTQSIIPEAIHRAAAAAGQTEAPRVKSALP